jgi:Importin beta binding domain
MMTQMAESHRRREARTIRIRKLKKEEYLHKRRGTTPRTEHHETVAFARFPQIIDISLVIKSMKDFPSDETVTLNLHLMQEILRMDESMTVKAIVDSGCLSFLASLLKRYDSFHFQHTATWILTEISIGGFCTDVFGTAGVLEDLVTLLQSPHAPVREQSGRCLGVLANDRIQFRDKLHEIGVVQHL